MSDWRRSVALLLMAASGFAGLGYQIVWTQQGTLWLGHEAAAILAVVAAFFGGLALGALTMGPSIERSAHPLRWYAACEATIALWGLVLLGLMEPFSDRMLTLTGVQPTPAWQWTVAFVGMFVLLLPATAAMGATLPSIERVVSSMETGDVETGRERRHGRSIAALYASNTFGAVIGVLAAAFWLVPAIGLSGTSLVCIALNAFCAIASQTLATRGPVPVVDGTSAAIATGRRRVLLRLAATGLIGIGYEVLVVRVLSQVCEDTVYTFAMLLAVYLLGSAAGAAAYERWSVRRAGRAGTDGDRSTDRLLCTLAATCLAGTGALYAAEELHAVVLGAAGGGVPAAIGTEALLAVAAFALPTFAMGATFSHLADQARAAGVGFGRSLGLNIAGAATAPLLVGVWLAPLLGARTALLLLVAGYLALTTREAWTRRPMGWPVALVALLVATMAPVLAFVDVPPGGRVVSYREGITAAVSVVEDADGVARLRIDNREQEGSSATRLVDGRQALLPLLLASAPRHALFLGLGTGVTASSAATMSGLEVDAVELLPEVIAASTRFTRAFGDGVPNPRLHLIAADARRYVRITPLKYELIVADNFHPARGGSGALYTVEHFGAIRARLVDDGLFCQWLPLHQLDLATMRSIVRSFLSAYPGGWAMLASNSLGTPVVGLVGRRDGGRFSVATVRANLAQSKLPDGPAAFGIDDEYALLGSFFAGPEALERFAGDATANTDDRPVVAYRAPAATYAPRSQPQDRLVELLHATSIRPDELLVETTARGTAGRLAAYWSARNRFVDAGRGVRPSADVRQMLAQVHDPLMDVLRTSPDFRPAYDPLYRMAMALARTDADGGRALLAELAAVQPSRPEASRALDRMGAGRYVGEVP